MLNKMIIAIYVETSRRLATVIGFNTIPAHALRGIRQR